MWNRYISGSLPLPLRVEEDKSETACKGEDWSIAQSDKILRITPYLIEQILLHLPIKLTLTNIIVFLCSMLTLEHYSILVSIY